MDPHLTSHTEMAPIGGMKAAGFPLTRVFQRATELQERVAHLQAENSALQAQVAQLWLRIRAFETSGLLTQRKHFTLGTEHDPIF